MTDATVPAMRRAIGYLAKTQHEAGTWTDFWLPVGTSDAWVTAYTGLALVEASACLRLPRPDRKTARRMAEDAASWLEDCARPLGGWGYNAGVPPDADSTAHAVSLLARLGRDVPDDALCFIEAHRVDGEGYRTYRWRDAAHQWTHPSPDVTAACLRALHDAGLLDEAALRDAWRTMLAPHQDADGRWQGYWWPSDAYPTSLALEIGQPGTRHRTVRAPDDAPAFETACDLLSLCALQDAATAASLAQRLVDTQQRDGAWPGAPVLKLPPSHLPDPAPRQLIHATDARRVFTTATALKALARFASTFGATSLTSTRRRPAEGRSETGRHLDRLVARAAEALGFDREAAMQAARTFALLTSRSLAEPCPWPSAQLSSLSAGLPLEFSVAVGKDEPPALRYTAELGLPHLPPQARARSSVEALSETSRRLGYNEAWRRVLPAIEALTDASIPAPDGLRFWVWGGVDCAVPPPGRASVPLLKVYLNLLHREASPGKRLETALGAAGIPLHTSTAAALDLLDAHGYRHECGFGLGPGGQIAFKLYYELPGWRPDLAAAVLRLAGIDAAIDAIRPEIPGLLREPLARKRRAGIALRLDPADGTVRELTTAAAFLPPMLPDAEVNRRVHAWLNVNGWDTTAYDALSHLLLTGRRAAPRGHAGMHSLFTRTVAADGASSATVYLRPYLPSLNPTADYESEVIAPALVPA